MLTHDFLLRIFVKVKILLDFFQLMQTGTKVAIL